MSLFTINEDKCTKCNRCVADCPVCIISRATDEAVPSPIENAASFCINCGHCVAVCPTDALTLSTMDPGSCPAIKKDLLPKEESMAELLRARRSVRKFKDQPVSRGILAELIDVGRYAPTGSNSQQVHWAVFEKQDDVKRLATLVGEWMMMVAGQSPDPAMAQRMSHFSSRWQEGEDVILRSAPHVIVVHGPAPVPCIQYDCDIALTYLELYACSMGLGTCWAGFLTAAANMHPPVAEALALPEGHKLCGGVMIGYPEFGYHRIPTRNAAQVEWR